MGYVSQLCESTSNLRAYNTQIFSRATNVDVPTYLTAYADGEGCFCASINRSTRHKFGLEIRPSFSVSQNQNRSEVLDLFKGYFGCGTIRPDRSDKTLKYEVRSLKDLVSKVIPHFEKYPIISAKNEDFKVFKVVCLRMFVKEHLTKTGLKELLVLSKEINKSGLKKYINWEIKI